MMMMLAMMVMMMMMRMMVMVMDDGDDDDGDDDDDDDGDDGDDDEDDDDDGDAFITINNFMEEVEREKPLSWVDLPKGDLFQVLSVEDKKIEEDNGKVRIAQIGTIKNEKGTIHKVWLPSVVYKKVIEKMTLDNSSTFMKKQESVISKRNKRQYHNADVVSKIKKQK